MTTNEVVARRSVEAVCRFDLEGWLRSAPGVAGVRPPAGRSPFSAPDWRSSWVTGPDG